MTKNNDHDCRKIADKSSKAMLHKLKANRFPCQKY